MSLLSYSSYRNLPAVAGIASLEEAMRIGLSIEDCVLRLKRQHWMLRRLHETFIKRLTAEPIYELKMIFSLHAHYCAEHTGAWRKRVGEMREPPLGLDHTPSAALDLVFEELLAAPTTEALLAGVYAIVLPELRSSIQHHMAESNRLVDHPTFRICRFALSEVDEMIQTGNACIARLSTTESGSQLAPWLAFLRELLSNDENAPLPPRQFSATPAPFDSVPRRDERFQDSYNMAVHAEAFLYDETMPPEPKPLMLYYKRLREIDVPEMMASIIAETPDKPWAYYVDMTRQLWDEARHAIMGEVGFVRAGIDWQKFVQVNFTWSLALNTRLKPLERHAVLYFIEQGLMPKTGKRFEWEVGIASGDPYSAMIQDYDWADEVLHARIGRDWFVSAIGDSKKAITYGDQCWSGVLRDLPSYKTNGLTQNENWWPALYAEWCRVQGHFPNSRVFGYSTGYDSTRADLADISASS
ncbi:hypothetical protein [Oleiharenicola lentus]|uniref:hypothetical protein n=1 Tax=Oleiharenicola lentus TaxID=2508720 RepID=UPI003F6745EC